MALFELHTNEGKYYVESSIPTLRKAMFAYIKTKRKEDISLGMITFCWTRLPLSNLTSIMNKVVDTTELNAMEKENV